MQKNSLQTIFKTFFLLLLRHKGSGTGNEAVLLCNTIVAKLFQFYPSIMAFLFPKNKFEYIVRLSKIWNLQASLVIWCYCISDFDYPLLMKGSETSEEH